MAKMRTEGAKIDGTPVMTVMTFDAVKSAAQIAEEQKQRDSEAKPSVGGGIGGLDVVVGDDTQRR